MAISATKFPKEKKPPQKTGTDIETLRHDCAHVMAQAVKELYPGTKVAIGPPVADGFYYDFMPKKPFAESDLAKIEKRMLEIVKRNQPITREIWEREKARKFFAAEGEDYKLQLLEDIPEGEVITVYRQGNFTDLCRGPHQDSTAKVGDAFKLLRLAGAYWRGDSANEMLQRIYGTAWFKRRELEEWLANRAEAEKRDHRKIGRQMGLFHMQEEAPGSVFWHPRGWQLFSKLVEYMRSRQLAAGYEEINTPQVIDRSLWEKSGHWEAFRPHMFTTHTEDERVFAVKPMNCPGAVQIFKQGNVSYRSLPRRMAEFGKVHRYEPSGALYGLMRVRAFTQDDAHIFCSREQMADECRKVIDLTLDIYKDFGFEDVEIKFADRPPNRIGEDEVWDMLESSLLAALKESGLAYGYNKGEGAFYGPKLEFILTDALGRSWQCGTLQADFSLPQRLDAAYVDADGTKKPPILLHRAFFGSLERFIGILLEHGGGRLPLWLSPMPVAVLTITDGVLPYAEKVVEKLRQSGILAELDGRNEKIGYKIREHAEAKVPIFLVLGGKEADEEKVAVRRLGSQSQEVMKVDEFIAAVIPELAMPGSGKHAMSSESEMKERARSQ